jgi:serine/threonine-protein kinase
VRRVDEIAPRQLRGADDVSFPFWSPDGRWIGFFAARKIRKIPASGGQALIIGDSPFPLGGGTWGPESAGDNIVIFIVGRTCGPELSG